MLVVTTKTFVNRENEYVASTISRPDHFQDGRAACSTELALKDKALSFEARRQLVAAEASAYVDAATMVQGKANAAATALAVVNLKDTMKAGDRRQYDDGYAESVTELISELK